MATYDRRDFPTYRFLRTPRKIEELALHKRQELFVWMDNGTLVLISTDDGAPVITKFQKCFYMTFSEVMVDIFGDSDDAVIETAVFFGTLESSAEQIELGYNHNLSIDNPHAEQLALIMDKHQNKTIYFPRLTLNTAFSAVIASRPYPIRLKLFRSWIDSDAFSEQLQGRTASFGSLSLESMKVEMNVLRRIFNRLELFEELHVDVFPSDLLLKLLSAPMKSISFDADIESDKTDLSAADIVPKNICIKTTWGSKFPFQFMASFLHRVVQLGHLESLDLTFNGHRPGPVDIGKALIRAIGANKKLKTLKLVPSEQLLDNSMKGIFGVLEQHEVLHTFRFDKYPKTHNPRFTWLKRLLRRNRRLEVTDSKGKEWEYDDELKEIYAMNRFFRGSERLTKAATAIRPLLMGAAFTHSAAGEFQRAGLLLKDHMDVFCEILHAMEFSDRVDAENSPARRITEDGLVHSSQPESRAGQKRQRSDMEEQSSMSKGSCNVSSISSS